MNEKKAKTYKNSFSKVITRWMIVLSIIPLIIFGLFSLFFITQSTKDTGRVRVGEAVQSAQSLLSSSITSYDEQMDLLAKDNQIHSILIQDQDDNEDKKIVLNKLYTILGTKSKEISIHLVDIDSDITFSTQKVPQMYNPLQFRNWGVLRFAQSRVGHQIHPNHYVWDNGTNNSFSITRLVLDVDHSPLGIIIMDFSRDFLEKQLSSMTSTQFGNIAFVITSESDSQIFNGSNLVTNEVRSGQNFLAINKEVLDKDYTVSTEFDPNLKVKLIGLLSNEYLETNAFLVSLAVLITIIPTLFLALMMGLFVSDKIVSPILSLASKVRQIKTSQEYGLTQLNRQDEVGEIDQAFFDLMNRIEEYHRIDMEKREQVRIAEVKALQSQINPHFLYNTLDSIKWQAKLNGVESIAKMITELSTMLKASMDHRHPLVKVSQELELVNSFVYIQNQRLSQPITFTQEIEDSILNLYIPKLILQPLIENAYLHGIANKLERGQVKLIGYRDTQFIYFQILDNGDGFKVSLHDVLNHPKNHGVGLNNVDKRIKLYYGDEFGLTVKRLDDYTKVGIKLLIHPIGEEDV